METELVDAPNGNLAAAWGGLSLFMIGHILQENSPAREDLTISMSTELLDVVAVAFSLSNVTLPAGVAPGTETTLYTDGHL